MEIDLDTYREQSLETWGQMAQGWEDRREWLMDITGRVNDWLVQEGYLTLSERVTFGAVLHVSELKHASFFLR